MGGPKIGRRVLYVTTMYCTYCNVFCIVTLKRVSVSRRQYRVVNS